jgi:hypothetical protein
MRTVFALIALSLVAGTPVLAQDAAPGAAAPAAAAPAAGPLTAAAAKKARFIAVASGGGYSIDHINAAPDGSVASVTIIYEQRFVNIPGSTVSAGEKPTRLKTSLTDREIGRL